MIIIRNQTNRSCFVRKTNVIHVDKKCSVHAIVMYKLPRLLFSEVFACMSFIFKIYSRKVVQFPDQSFYFTCYFYHFMILWKIHLIQQKLLSTSTQSYYKLLSYSKKAYRIIHNNNIGFLNTF